jgi:mRNA interferase RelE/StbE
VTYAVELTEAAERDLDRLLPDLRGRVVMVLTALGQTPRPPGAAAIRSAPPGHYRLRLQNLRIGYEVDDKTRTVTVWQIGDRKRFYDQAKRRRK